jgi:hypothetical protein
MVTRARRSDFEARLSSLRLRKTTKTTASETNRQQRGVDDRRIQEATAVAYAGLLHRHVHFGAAVHRFRTARGVPNVPSEHDEADQIHQAAECADVHEHFCRGHGIKEIRIREHRAALFRRAEHEALREWHGMPPLSGAVPLGFHHNGIARTRRICRDPTRS